MISTPDRQTANALIVDAVTAGARRARACAELEISDRTLRRWLKDGQVQSDQRPLVPRPEPANKLSAAERATVLEACNSTEFASLPPAQIVPRLADQGRYLASESSFYRILRADGQQHHRGRAKLHDSQVWDELLHGEETSVWADKGYVSAEREAAFKAPGKVWGVMRKAPKGGTLHPLDERINRIIAMVRAKVEHPFRVIKCQFGHTKTRYRGLAKNRTQLFTLFALGNLFLVRRRLMA